MISESPVTWQKIAVIVATLVVIVPVAGRYAWNVVFPANYLLYETTFATKTIDTKTASIIVTNAGLSVQKNVEIYIPTKDVDPKITTIDISPQQDPSLSYLSDADPNIPLAKYTTASGSKIPIGIIEPGEQVRVTLSEISKDDSVQFLSFSLSDVWVDSSKTEAIKADGLRYPDFANDAHSMFLSASPYILALLILILVVTVVIATIFTVFFDSHQKQMSRLWRQMDTLQENIDKKRRYD